VEHREPPCAPEDSRRFAFNFRPVTFVLLSVGGELFQYLVSQRRFTENKVRLTRGPFCMLTVQRQNLQHMINHSQSHLLARAAPHVTPPAPNAGAILFSTAHRGTGLLPLAGRSGCRHVVSPADDM